VHSEVLAFTDTQFNGLDDVNVFHGFRLNLQGELLIIFLACRYIYMYVYHLIKSKSSYMYTGEPDWNTKLLENYHPNLASFVGRRKTSLPDEILCLRSGSYWCVFSAYL